MVPQRKKQKPEHSLEWEEVIKNIQSNAKTGLTTEQVKENLQKFGKNTLPKEKPPSNLRIFVRQFKSPLIFILVIAGFVTFILDERTDSIVIFSAVLLNTVIGYIQESKATKSLDALKKILQKKAIVVRNGIEKEIDQEEIVPGDIIVLGSGNSIPADARIIEHWELNVQEAQLTGEWLASSKHTKVLDADTALADRDNMVYMGSTVSHGTGKAVVVATAKHTELGKIATLLKEVKEEKTPYQKKLSRFSWIIGAVVGVMAILIFFQGIFVGRPGVEMFTIAVAIAVSAIPEGLPIAMTAVLAVGMRRILAKNGLVRRLASAETLGSTSVIATDKTLTLTEGKMEVEEIFTLKEADREEALRTAALANEAFIENPEAVFEKLSIKGRPTDKALIWAAMEAGVSKSALEKEMPLVLRLPFDSEQKYIASFHKKSKQAKGMRVYVSGAPETILALSHCTRGEKNTAEKTLKDLASKGLRVVGLATKDVLKADKEQIRNLHFIGFIALKDPLRREVKPAIALARKAGLKVILVTGDHLLTAKAIGEEIGMKTQKKNIINGTELEKISDKELAKRLNDIEIYARVEPAHKLRIIEAWQNKGAVIAMTGDGVNDAPALKRADIGLALGSGTDVAKEASDIILLGDNFSIIPAAIREGRVITDNIRKIITYLLSGAFTETILIGTSLILQTPFLPITALQILWINLVVDGLPGISLVAEKPEKDVMDRPPQKKNSRLLTGEMKTIIFAIGLITDLLLLALFFWLLNNTTYSAAHIQTVIFIGLGLASLFYVFSIKSLRKNIWQYNPFSNRFLTYSVLLGFILLISVVYIPPFNTLMETEALSFFDWSILIGLALLNVVLIEIAKWFYINKKS